MGFIIMEVDLMDKKTGKKEILLLIVIFLAILAIFCAYQLRQKEEGNTVRVTIDGEEYGTYSLNKDQEIPIEIDGEVTNFLVITDGCADMIEANCPDQLCVEMKAVSVEGETIVCLPNKVVVEVTESEAERDIDVLVQ